MFRNYSYNHELLPGPEHYDRELLINAYNVYAQVKHTPPIEPTATKEEAIAVINKHTEKSKHHFLSTLQTAQRARKLKKSQEKRRQQRNRIY